MREGVPDRDSGILAASYASFVLIGWAGLLVPSYLRVIRDEFARTDAEFGVAYLVMALLFAVGALAAGLIADRIGRRVVLPAAALLTAIGLVTEGVAPTWPIFVAGAGLAGAGCGAIDAGVNSVVMDLSATGHGSGLNRLHLFYSVGALAAPLAIGILAAAGIDWRVVAAATGLAGLALMVPLRRVGTVPPRRRTARDDVAEGRSETSGGLLLRLAVAGLAVGIACYVAAESGVSSWLVGFLVEEPMSVATLCLGLFWAALAGGRLAGSRFADRFDPVHLTASCSVAGALALAAAVAGPSGPPRIALFMAAGFAFGPIYPMIMTVAGTLLPHRAAAVSGLLAASAVAGSVVYPPAMGLMSGPAGLGAGMLGAAMLAAVAGIAVVAAGRAGRSRALALASMVQ